jgi:ATPase complex subunit ATP10
MRSGFFSECQGGGAPRSSGPQACCCSKRASFFSFSKLCRTTMRIAPARHLVRTVIARCQNKLLDSSLSHLQSSPNRGSSRSLNIFTIFNKEARAKEQARLTDELNRGYFDDIRQLKKTGGKFGIAARNLVPIAAAPKFPSLIVQSPGGTPAFELPIQEGQNHVGPTLLCVAFRASAQAMVESWSKPFSKMFKPNNGIQIFEVSVIESWLLSLKPIRSLLLRTVRDAEPPAATVVGEVQILLQRKVVYSFGDTYFFRKTLGIPNLLSGYVFLLDNKGRVRWRASGMATAEELTSMESCTLRLLEEQSPKAHKSDSQQQIAQHSSDRR